MKKKIIYILLLLGVSGTTISCESLLEEKSYDFVSPEDLGDSDKAANQYVIGAYNALQTTLFGSGGYLYLTNMDCDYASGADWAFGNVGAGNIEPFWGKDIMWNGSYTLIHRTNLGLARIGAMKSITEEVKNRYMGEMNFLKAWAYFNLVRNYGGIPLRDVALSEGGEISVPRSTIAQAYEKIIDLLKNAETVLPSPKDTNYIAGRVTRGAAKALLAKTYLTMASGALSGAKITVKGGLAREKSGDEWVPIDQPTEKTFTKTVVTGYEGFDAAEYFRLARDKAWEMIDTDKDYTLFSTYSDVWKVASRNQGEHIWMLQAKSNDPSYGNTICYDYTGILLADGTLDGNWYGMREHWYALFEPTDERVIDGVVHRWSVGLGSDGKPAYNYYPRSYASKVTNKEAYDSAGHTYDGKEAYNSKTGWSLAKLTKFTNVTDRTVKHGDFHFPILRYADVLLIFAEAENEVNGGPTTRAYKAVNDIRNRAKAGSFEDMNQEQFRSAVLEERARELAYEADRRYDLFRWGIYLDVMNDIDIDEHNILKRRTQRNLLYPIPTAEVNSNEFIHENNPGW